MPTTIIPKKLQSGDTVMVIAPSDSYHFMPLEVRDIAYRRFQDIGLNVIFSDHAEEYDVFDTSAISSRVHDLHQAFANPEVKGIIAAFGGYHVHELFRYIDWDIIAQNPKILVGYSDMTALSNAIFAKTGLVTYSGPNYVEFGRKWYFETTLNWFQKALMEEGEQILQPSQYWSDDYLWLNNQDDRTLMSNLGWEVIQEGQAEGRIIGGNAGTFQLLQGTEYFPDLIQSILFLEEDYEEHIGRFARYLQAFIHHPQFSEVQGIVLGRFQQKAQATSELIHHMIKTKSELQGIPVIAGVDFGHTDPMITFPIGGQVTLNLSSQHSEIMIRESSSIG